MSKTSLSIALSILLLGQLSFASETTVNSTLKKKTLGLTGIIVAPLLASIKKQNQLILPGFSDTLYSNTRNNLPPSPRQTVVDGQAVLTRNIFLPGPSIPAYDTENKTPPAIPYQGIIKDIPPTLPSIKGISNIKIKDRPPELPNMEILNIPKTTNDTIKYKNVIMVHEDGKEEKVRYMILNNGMMLLGDMNHSGINPATGKAWTYKFKDEATNKLFDTPKDLVTYQDSKKTSSKTPATSSSSGSSANEDKKIEQSKATSKLRIKCSKETKTLKDFEACMDKKSISNFLIIKN